MTDLPVDREIDCSGMSCPVPMLKAKKAIADLESGQVLKLIATDPTVLGDMAAWTERAQHELVHQDVDREANRFVLFVRKGS
ncbi:MAG: sulfurtransferase TusA family protein [Planctomycetota bacterium]